MDARKKQEFTFTISTTFLLLLVVTLEFCCVDSFLHLSCRPTTTRRNILFWVEKRGENDRKSKESDKNIPGYKFFQGNGSYVPSGMSREDYTKLRKTEIEKVQKMNFGAWGPRFKRTDAPDGDWMIMPNLWTLGQVRRQSSSGMDGIDTSRSPSRIRNLVINVFGVVRNYFPLFLLGYFLLDCLEIGAAMWLWNAQEMTWKKAIRFIIKTICSQREVFRISVMKAEAVKIICAALITPILNKLMEWWNRRRLWTRKRSSMVVISVLIMVLTLWHSALHVLPLG
jgi:hypothetical protein